MDSGAHEAGGDTGTLALPAARSTGPGPQLWLSRPLS